MDVEEIKARLAAASKGPWYAAKVGSQVGKPYLRGSQEYITKAEDDCILDADNNEILGCSEWMRVDWKNLEFMAHARQDIEDLIFATEAMQAKIDELNNQIAHLESELAQPPYTDTLEYLLSLHSRELAKARTNIEAKDKDIEALRLFANQIKRTSNRDSVSKLDLIKTMQDFGLIDESGNPTKLLTVDK